MCATSSKYSRFCHPETISLSRTDRSELAELSEPSQTWVELDSERAESYRAGPARLVLPSLEIIAFVHLKLHRHQALHSVCDHSHVRSLVLFTGRVGNQLIKIVRETWFQALCPKSTNRLWSAIKGHSIYDAITLNPIGPGHVFFEHGERYSIFLQALGKRQSPDTSSDDDDMKGLFCHNPWGCRRSRYLLMGYVARRLIGEPVLWSAKSPVPASGPAKKLDIVGRYLQSHMLTWKDRGHREGRGYALGIRQGVSRDERGNWTRLLVQAID